MSVPVMKPDRRRAPRIKPAGLAYINIEPDNGGIVLNVSEGGLCFHSVAPVEAAEVVRFWFSADGERIDLDGRLAWSDDKRKTGGLKFGKLSGDALERIRNWMAQSSESFQPQSKGARPTRPPTLPVPVRPEPKANGTTALHDVTNRRVERLKELLRWNDYSRGLATGLLVATIVAGGFFLHGYRRQLGQELIRIGEYFAAQAPGAAGAAKSNAASVSGLSHGASVATPAGNGEARAEQVTTKQIAATPAKYNETPVVPEKAIAQRLPPKQGPVAPPAPGASESESSFVPASSIAALPLPPDASKIAQPIVALPPSRAATSGTNPLSAGSETEEDVAEVNSGVPLGKYFELAKYKYALRAQEEAADLAHYGIQAIVVPQNRLWLSSYEVLAGPYPNDQTAQTARTSLQSQGYKPHAMPKRSRQLSFAPPANVLSQADAITGSFVVSWEAYGSEATVRFVKDGNTVATARGKWVKRAAKYQTDGIEYQRNEAGSRTLIEIWFRGMNEDIVLSGAVEGPVVF